MRKFWCWLTGHDVQQRVWYRVGGVYPRYLVWCQCCGRWLEDQPPVRRRPSWLM